MGSRLPIPPGAMIARSVGIVCIAVGFVVGIEALVEPNSTWLRTALALIVTGLAAQGYALYRTLKRIRQLNSAQQNDGDSRHDDQRRDR